MKRNYLVSIGIAFCAIFFASCTKNLDIITSTNNIGKVPNLEQVGQSGERIKFIYNNEEVFVNKIGDKYIFMGDIILSDKQVSMLKGEKNARTAVSSFISHWIGGVVYYSINSSINSTSRSRIAGAINTWQASTSIRWRLRTNQPDYVEFVSGDGCSATLGRIGGRQQISISSTCPEGSILHEMGHSIGLIHEQNRSDRDDYVLIHEENIEGGQNVKDQFKKYNSVGISGFQIGTYDFFSLMGYGSTDFAYSGTSTITKKSDNSTFNFQRSFLSTGDLEITSAMYGPPYGRVTKEQLSYDSNSGGTTSSYTEEADYFVDWYYDVQCTLPYTGNAPRVVTLAKYLNQANGQGGYTNYGGPTLTFSQLNGEYGRIWIGRHFNYENTDRGDVISGVNVEFNVLSGNRGSY